MSLKKLESAVASLVTLDSPSDQAEVIRAFARVLRGLNAGGGCHRALPGGRSLPTAAGVFPKESVMSFETADRVHALALQMGFRDYVRGDPPIAPGVLLEALRPAWLHGWYTAWLIDQVGLKLRESELPCHGPGTVRTAEPVPVRLGAG